MNAVQICLHPFRCIIMINIMLQKRSSNSNATNPTASPLSLWPIILPTILLIQCCNINQVIAALVLQYLLMPISTICLQRTGTAAAATVYDYHHSLMINPARLNLGLVQPLAFSFYLKALNNVSNNKLVHNNKKKVFRMKKSLDKFYDHLMLGAGLNGADLSNSHADTFPMKPFSPINSSYFEYLINDKIKLSRKLHLLLSLLTHPNNTLSDRHGDSTDLISKSTAQALRKSKRKMNITNSLTNAIGRCFEPYGCFRITEPFRTIYRPINLIPEHPNSIKIAFYLRTRSNPTVPERLVYNENSEFLVSKYFRSESDLKMIVHGYLESSDEYWVNEMSMALLNRADLNVICVDWMLGASPPYSQAVANTRLVGSMIAHFIQIIQKSHPKSFASTNIHIIGHSLGAHVAGYTGQLIDNLGQITGLDPAEPYFQYTDPIVRLDPTDALFVDVIHSDVASIMSGGFGMSQPCGHVDFYPNGGIDQPGCRQASFKNVMDYIAKEKNLFDGIRRFIGCNHARSFLIYIEAINSECPFMAYPCHSYMEFINGQCTSTLIDNASSYGHCLTNINNNENNGSPGKTITCPIRLGLDSEQDYKMNSLLNTDQNAFNISKMPYFLQTNDRSPYCNYHYNVKLLFQSRKLHGKNYRTLPRNSNNYEWPFNGKLHSVIVGTRNRITMETFLKQANFHTEQTGWTTVTDNEVIIDEFNMLASGGDLGKLLRLELDWRNQASQIQRSLATMQTKTLKRFLSQRHGFESTASSLMANNFLNDIHHYHQQQPQRTFYSNQTSTVGNQPNLFKHWPGPIMLNDLILMKSSASASSYDAQPPLSNEMLTLTKSDPAEQITPKLWAIVVHKLETNEQSVFCVTDKPIQEMFQTKRLSKSFTLLTTYTLDLNRNDNGINSTSTLSSSSPPSSPTSTSSTLSSATTSSTSVSGISGNTVAHPGSIVSIVSNVCRKIYFET